MLYRYNTIWYGLGDVFLINGARRNANVVPIPKSSKNTFEIKNDQIIH